ncbi:hypothetical protein OSB04_007865 [Centaurea solstitialis]|uniref:Hexosyltransferase n=1 Tax=Centaurea solstitialis TaxID=347529 RepID=A0AA38TXB4_9ASTR|nr:hypothetical protein OSB04_007865 [Centaurea solstitialis]
MPMPSSRRFFHARQYPSTISPRSIALAVCSLIGCTGFLSLFAIVGFGGDYFTGVVRCNHLKPISVSVGWDRSGGGGGDSGYGLVSDGDDDRVKRRKVMAFVGIQTGFGSVGRRRSLRKTWMPSDHQGLQRLEESTGLAFRFVIGKTRDQSKMAELRREVEEYDDFLLLDIEEEYSKLPYKTIAFFKAAYALYDSDFYVKADDDIYLRPDRLSLLLAKDRQHTQTYLGCMKKGPVFTDPKLKWHEPLGYMLGKEYFLHAYGPIYALSADVVASLVSLRNNRQVSVYLWQITSQTHTHTHTLCLPKNSKHLKGYCYHCSFRMFSNEDVTIGAWMLAMNVRHENNRQLCQPECTPTSIAVWDLPKCSGLCNPEKKLLELHEMKICSNSPTLPSNE